MTSTDDPFPADLAQFRIEDSREQQAEASEGAIRCLSTAHAGLPCGPYCVLAARTTPIRQTPHANTGGGV